MKTILKAPLGRNSKLHNRNAGQFPKDMQITRANGFQSSRFAGPAGCGRYTVSPTASQPGDQESFSNRNTGRFAALLKTLLFLKKFVHGDRFETFIQFPGNGIEHFIGNEIILQAKIRG